MLFVLSQSSSCWLNTVLMLPQRLKISLSHADKNSSADSYMRTKTVWHASIYMKLKQKIEQWLQHLFTASLILFSLFWNLITLYLIYNDIIIGLAYTNSLCGTESCSMSKPIGSKYDNRSIDSTYGSYIATSHQ